MVDNNKKKEVTDKEKPIIHQQEREGEAGNQEKREVKDNLEKINSLKIEEIKKRLEDQALSQEMQEEIQREAENLMSANEPERTEKLLAIAKKKGVVSAINIAKKMTDFDIDTFHDVLAKNGLYKEFLK